MLHERPESDQSAKNPNYHPQAWRLANLGLTLSRALGALRLAMPVVVKVAKDNTCDLVYTLEAVDELILNASYEVCEIETAVRAAEEQASALNPESGSSTANIRPRPVTANRTVRRRKVKR